MYITKTIIIYRIKPNFNNILKYLEFCVLRFKQIINLNLIINILNGLYDNN
jgi:hypothetical protein